MKIVYVDIDECLIYSRLPVPGSTYFNWGGESCYTIARPYIEEFLTKLQEKYRVEAVTQGVLPFQGAALHAVGLAKYIDDMYGWETLDRNSVHLPTKEDLLSQWLLIDNLLAHDHTLDDKKNWLGQDFKEGVNFLNIDPFYGDSDCGSILDLLPKIEEILG